MMSVNNVIQRLLSSTRYRQYNIRNLSSSITISKDPKQHSPDILMNKFRNATSVQGVLDTFSQHKDVMNSKHILQALRSVFILQKEGRSELSTRNIIDNAQFAHLCRKLKTLAGVINSAETIEALKCVMYVGVPKDSTIVQVLLQLLRHNINDLTLQQIIFTDFLLSHYTDVPLAEALKIALPMVFEIQLPIKIDTENIHSLREYLQFASKHKLSDKSVDLILSKMANCREGSDIQLAKSIVWSLSDLKPRPSFKPLIEKNLKILTAGNEELSYEDLDITLKKLATAYVRSGYTFFRNESYCHHVSDFVIENMGFRECVYVMKKLDLLCVTSKRLIDYVSKCMVESNANIENNSYFYYTFLKYLDKTNYRPGNWNTIKELIEDMEITEINNVDPFKVVLTLCYHQIFKDNLISLLLKKILTKRKKTPYLDLYHSLLLYKPELLRLFPSDFRPMDYVEDVATSDVLPLEGALFSAFGGEKYVKSRMYSKEGIFIDHMILFRKGAYPVATSFDSMFIEDFPIPEDNEMVLIKCLKREAYTEEQHLRTKYSFQLKVLEKCGYTVVPVCLENWQSLLDYEKIPYLVQNIKNKFGADMSVNKYG